MSKFDEVYNRSLADPEGFWSEAAEAIHWEKKWDTLIDDSNPPFYRWFAGAECNTCYNAVDRHVEEGRADQLAVIYDSPITGSKKTFTYRELQAEVAKCAGVLKKHGVSKGDRVVLYLPPCILAAAAMHACNRIGAVHAVVFAGFSPQALASRINVSE